MLMGLGNLRRGILRPSRKICRFPPEEAPASLSASQCLMGISLYLFYSPPLRLPLARVLFQVHTTVFYFYQSFPTGYLSLNSR
jgi:hypothetical protein